MPETSTIQLEKKIIRELKETKQHPRQTYSDLVGNLLKAYKAHKSQYDKYLHAIQQEKMAELWGNKEDEAWEHA